MLDPNLEKIKQYHMEEIEQGKVGYAIKETEDYLEYILGFKEKQIRKELNNFARHLRHLQKKGE